MIKIKQKNKYKKPIVVCIGFLFICSLLTAQRTVKFYAPKHNRIILREQIGNNYYPLDSVYSDKGNFVFNIENRQTGFYELYKNDTNRIQIIINEKEPEINLVSDSLILQNGVEVKVSTENQILWGFKYFTQKKQKEERVIRILLSQISQTDPKSQVFQKQLLDIQKEKENWLDSAFAINPNTYFEKVLTSNNTPTENQYPSFEERKKHFFDEIDFSDESLIRSSVYTGIYLEYFQNYTEFNEAGFQSSINTILEKANKNPIVYEFTLNFLLELFDKVGPKLIYQYLIETYVVGEGCGDHEFESRFSNDIEGYRRMMPGNIAPDVFVYDFNRNAFSLKHVVKQKPYSLLIFWSSQCPHCEKAIPVLKEIYDSLPKDKIQFIGISNDLNLEDWLIGLDNIGKNDWKHYSELQGWDSNITKTYKVHKTPSFFLLRDNMVILSKPKNEDELREVLDKYLN